jgi:hypothetical protein
MFRKLSRYYKLPDEVTVDASGHKIKSKSLRLPPAVEAGFQHTVEAADRLDHLAFKYYRQPRKWWRICDANPDFLSPHELLGDTPVVADRFSLTPADAANPPSLAALRRQVTGLVGVLDFRILEAGELTEEVRTVGVEDVTVWADEVRREVVVTYNTMNVRVAALAAAMAAAGFTAGEPARVGRVGKAIAIPRDSVR